MNLLHLMSQKQLTGAEVYAAQLIKCNSSYHEPDHIFQLSNEFFIETEAIQGRLPVEVSSFKEFFTSVSKLRSFLIENTIHVIHCHSRSASKLAYYARIGLNVGMVSTVHGRQHVSFSKKIMNNYGDFIIAICENVQEQLTTEFKYNPRYIKTIPNPVCTKRFEYNESNIREDTSTIAIAIVGRTTGPKKQRTIHIVKLLSEFLKRRNITPQFTIIGGSGLDEIAAYNITYHAHLEVSSSLLHQYQLIIGSGRTCIEALMCGVPCIAYGEAVYCGLITPQNFEIHATSNFGDIGKSFELPIPTIETIENDWKTYCTASIDLKKVSEMTSEKYNSKLIFPVIKRLYESAYFIRNYKKWIPILMYHKIPLAPINSPHKIFVTKENFEKHLKFFKKSGFTTITFQELSAFRKAQRNWSDFPRRPLMLTFDDGYEDNLLNAMPLLKQNGMKANIYLLADNTLDYNKWDVDLDANEPKCALIAGTDRMKWIVSPFEIGSHGFHHQRIVDMNASEKTHELLQSKTTLQTEFGKPIISFAFTYGATNSSVAKAAQDNGYEYAVNTDGGGLLMEEDPYSIFRVNIFPHENNFSLWKKTRSWYRYYYFKKKKK